MTFDQVANELRRALRNGHFEPTDDGRIHFNQLKILAAGVFEHNLNHGPWAVDRNLLVTEGLNYLLDSALRAQTQLSAWYVAPFAANVTPVAGLTAATFASTQTEFTNYTAAARQAWTLVAAASGVLTNAAAPAYFTVDDGVQTAIYGFGLLSASAKSSTSGKLVAAAKLATARTGLVEDDVIGARYSITLTSS